MNEINDWKLKFDEEKHAYTYNGIPLISVTQLIHEFTPEFNVKKFAAIVAKKRGTTSKEIVKEWAVAKKLGEETGTATHLYAENKILGKPQVPTNDEHLIKFRDIVDKYFVDHPTLKPYLSEIKLCSPIHRLAGTVDMVMKSDDGKYFLYDWKTSKEIKQHGYPGDSMLAPFEYLDNCNYVTYSLQLAIYKEMLAMKGIHVDGSYIIHLNGLTGTWKEFKALDLTQEARFLLGGRLTSLWQDVCLKRKETALKPIVEVD